MCDHVGNTGHKEERPHISKKLIVPARVLKSSDSYTILYICFMRTCPSVSAPQQYPAVQVLSTLLRLGISEAKRVYQYNSAIVDWVKGL